jgi:hypothetical protein
MQTAGSSWQGATEASIDDILTADFQILHKLRYILIG